MDEKLKEQAQKRVIAARIQLMSSHPFWAHLVLKMPLRWLEDVPGGLSCTDGESMFIAPERFLALSQKEQCTVLVHEAGHCVAGHLARRGSRDHMRFNLAGDIYLANMQEADRFQLVAAQEQMFKQMGINRGDYKNMSTEEIYEKMPQFNQPSQGQGSGKAGQGQGQGDYWQGGGCYHEAASSSKRSELEAKWKQAVIEAGQIAGNAPGAWRELVEAATPKPPFHLKLFEYLQKGMGGDPEWAHLSRRHIWRGEYLPTDTRIVMSNIAVAVDTSGSMSSQDQLPLAFGYIRAFREEHPCVLDLIQCDHDAVEKGQYKRYEEWESVPAKFEVIGRGGTSFDPPFRMLREKRIEPRVLIYLTDGFGTCSEKKPPYPVLWVVIRGDASFKAPFGEIVRVA